MKTGSSTETPETPEKKVEVYVEKKAWWAKIITPGRWKTVLGPFNNEAQAKDSATQKEKTQ